MTQDRDNFSERILEIEKEIRSQLNMVERKTIVEWLEPNQGIDVSRSFLPKGITPFFPSDQCYFEDSHLLLPSVLKERLAPEEFRPLVASALLYETRVLKWIALVRAVLVVTLVLAVSAVFSAFSRLGPWGLVSMVTLSVIVGLPMLMLFPFCFRVGRLSADKRVSRLIGTEDFLRTLEKIDSFRFPDIEKLKRSRLARARSSVPSITQRITVVRNAGAHGASKVKTAHFQ